jgi:2-C-methyl-D-erythritol 2,4-cyclodiphosphate synthase
MRVGWGFDAHRFGGSGPIVLGGVVIDSERGLAGTSDADVLAHAVADGLLGAAALGDLGTHFPSSDLQWRGVDSMALLGAVVDMVGAEGLAIAHVDATVIAETVRVGPFRQAIRERLATVLGVGPAQVSVKATTTDGLGFFGRDEGVGAAAIATLFAIGESA